MTVHHTSYYGASLALNAETSVDWWLFLLVAFGVALLLILVVRYLRGDS